ncbi:MAG: 50S ribosomal protein L29 [Candidatus Absconditabacteria bacterium]|nr:50S ribosomal protein L29 [Candidatus Absconditabacteria bacterium]MDD3868411.1 50S ribosomal protein L29 [Candidatus Absconditabacteria bacterium]
MKGTKSFMQSIKDKSPKELVSMRKKLREELFALKMKNAIRGLKETHQIGDLRVKIARINTVLKSKVSN